ncbi:MAG: 8-oxoguanine deaminase [Pseudomonadota bacterium]
MRVWIKQPLITWDPMTGARRDGGLVVAGNRIVEHVAAGATPDAIDEIVDARDLVLLPGLINTHHHFYQTLTRAHINALDKPLFPWLQALYPVWAGLTPEMIDLSTRLAAAELLLSGCTTAADHHYVFSASLTDAIDVQAQAMRAVGMRAVLTRGSMSLGESAGGLPPDAVCQDEALILRDSERLLKNVHDDADDALCQIALAPCSPFSVTPGLMRDTATLAAQHDALLHTHLAETEDENAFCLETFGRRPLDHIDDCGWLECRTWFAHGIHFTPAEIERIGAAGAGVCHCPSSNMLLASGTCHVAELEAAGANVGLGVDGSASNDGSNLIQEVRQAFLLQRLGAGAATSHLDALRWATEGSARLLHRPQLGHLGIGACADLALFALDEARFSGAEDPLAALVLCGATNARHVLVDGDWRVRDGTLTSIDLEGLQAAHRAAARELWAGVSA